MKLSETMKTALIAATGGEVSARPNTLRALAARDLVAVVDDRAVLTDEGKAVAAELRGDQAEEAETAPEAFGSPVFAETVLRAALDTPQPAPLPARPSGRNAIAEAGARFRTPLPVDRAGIAVGSLVTVPRVADGREVTGTVTEVFDSGHARPVRVVTVRDPRGVEYAGLYAEAVAVKRVHFTVDLGTHRVACRETGPGKYIASQRERDVTCPACREVLNLR